MKIEVKRKFAQFASFIIVNREIGNLFNGKIYKGEEKYLCAPGLNCYSCPAATLSCPLGALQTAIGAPAYGFGFYAFGFILMFGVLFGRFVCGFLCPFGFFQDLLAKIPFLKKRLYRGFNYIKYVVLAVSVIMLPLIGGITKGAGAPAFCEYICPAGTLEAAVPLLLTHPEYRDAIGILFAVKITVLLIVILGSITVYRFFCRVLCPLGALYGSLNKVSAYRMRFDESRCIGCGSCEKACPMGVNPRFDANSAECIRCGTCVESCDKNALRLSFRG